MKRELYKKLDIPKQKIDECIKQTAENTNMSISDVINVLAMSDLQDNTIYFYDTQKEYGEFSNFWDTTMHKKKYKSPLKLYIGGKTWSSSEEYYQAIKFKDQGKIGEEYIEILRAATTDAKKYALANQKPVGRYINKWFVDAKKDRRKIVDIITEYKEKGLRIRSDWEDIKDCVMRRAVFGKFNQNSHLRDLLLKTGKCRIVEDSPRDSYWGIGKDGTGKNMLGQILQRTREKLTEK